MVKIDTTGTIKQFIPYGKTQTGYDVRSSYSSRSALDYTPIVINEDKIYITQRPYRGAKIAQTPVSVAIDTINQEITELAFRFPPICTDEERPSQLTSFEFGREFNGKEFVYSFQMDENIYVAAPDQKEAKVIPTPSAYIKNIQLVKRPSDIRMSYKLLLELPL